MRIKVKFLLPMILLILLCAASALARPAIGDTVSWYTGRGSEYHHGRITTDNAAYCKILAYPTCTAPGQADVRCYDGSHYYGGLSEILCRGEWKVFALDPLGHQIIECCLNDGTLDDYLALTPMKLVK